MDKFSKVHRVHMVNNKLLRTKNHYILFTPFLRGPFNGTALFAT